MSLYNQSGVRNRFNNPTGEMKKGTKIDVNPVARRARLNRKKCELVDECRALGAELMEVWENQ